MIAVTSVVVAIAALAPAPIAQPTANTRRALKTSARFSAALIKVPITKPPCTAIVSHAVWVVVNPSSAAILGDAAVAENHNVMPRNCPMATSPSMRAGVPPDVVEA